MSSTATSVTVLGLGSMGLALVKAFLKSGKHVTIWNRTPERPLVKEAVEAGAKLEVSVQAAVHHSKHVLICVLDYNSIFDLLKQTGTALNGKAIINLTNGLPSEARAMSKYLEAEHNVASYFDGAIMTTPPLIGTEHSFIFVSGETESVLDQVDGTENVRSLINVLGRVDYRGTDPGEASLYDNALLASMYAMFGGAMTATGLLARGDKKALPAPSPEYMNSGLATVVGQSLIPMLQALLPTLVNIAASVELQEYGAHGHANSMMAAGLRNIIQTCEEENVEAGGLKRLMELFDKTIEEGGGDNGIGLVATKFLL